MRRKVPFRRDRLSCRAGTLRRRRRQQHFPLFFFRVWFNTRFGGLPPVLVGEEDYRTCFGLFKANAQSGHRSELGSLNMPRIFRAAAHTQTTPFIPESHEKNGAQERTRTSTPIRALAPEASASTNSATWA